MRGCTIGGLGDLKHLDWFIGSLGILGLGIYSISYLVCVPFFSVVSMYTLHPDPSYVICRL